MEDGQVEKLRKMEGPTIRFLCVRLITRCSAITWSLDWAVPRRLPKPSLAVCSSSSSSSAFLGSVTPAGDDARLDLELSGFSLRIVGTEEAGGWKGRSRNSRLSPALPLPVELVAGGEGRPECVDDAPGLGGSGRSGRADGEGVGSAPRKIADSGRRFDAREERGVIELKGLTGSSN
jgi:hypothetical protein